MFGFFRKNSVVCQECGDRFDNSTSEDPDDEICENCSYNLINTGRAIDMMNGEEDYDDDFVEKNL